MDKTIYSTGPGHHEEVHVLEDFVVHDNQLMSRIEVYDSYEERWVEKIVPCGDLKKLAD